MGCREATRHPTSVLHPLRLEATLSILRPITVIMSDEALHNINTAHNNSLARNILHKNLPGTARRSVNLTCKLGGCGRIILETFFPNRAISRKKV